MFDDFNEIKPKEVFPGFVGRFVHSEKMTFAYWHIKKGAALPEHNHVHEQVANMIDGKFELVVDGVARVLSPGMICVIPSNVKHSGRAVSDCTILDVFYPVREDYK